MGITARLASAAVYLSLMSVPVVAAEAPTMDPGTEAKLTAALASPIRTPAHVARDKYRHPLEMMKFFGLKRDMTVMEIWPSGGWWTEILAPVVAEQGHYIAALGDPGEEGGTLKLVAALKEKNPGLKIDTTPFLKAKLENVPAGSVDLVMTFRNIHNWMSEGDARDMFAAMYTALKPGGYLGVEEHRAPADKEQDPKASKGYVREDFAKQLIEGAGFRFVAASNVNDNPKDTKDYPKGVWTLPPNYAEGDKDRAKYTAIGESDRFTLLFQKPAK